MGWTSTADPLSNTILFFDTAEQAKHFANKQGTWISRVGWVWMDGWMRGDSIIMMMTMMIVVVMMMRIIITMIIILLIILIILIMIIIKHEMDGGRP